MQNGASAQRMNAGEDPVFTRAFYAPYEQAALSALAMLCAARARMSRAGGRDGVRAMTYRLKTPSSIRGKLLLRGLPVTREAARTLNDIAGLRAVLGGVGDVYRFADALLLPGTAELISARDYIASPKPSGYRSLHLILRLRAGERLVPAEIQLRTAPMDLWASLEHDAIYKPAGRG